MDSLINISAIIVNYNSAQYAINAIDSLFLNNNDVNLSIVIVDNGSIKGDVAILAKGIENKNNYKIKCLFLEKNYGYSYANNRGIEVAINEFNPDFLLICNPDIIVNERNIIAKLIDKIYNDKNVAFAMPSVYNIYKNIPFKKQIQIRNIERYSDTLICNSQILKRIFRKRFYNYINHKLMPFNTIIKAPIMSGAFFIIKKDAMLDVGCFDENVFLYHEEIILGYKLKKKNYIGILVPDVQVFHYQGMSFKNNIRNKINPFAFAYSTLSQLYYVRNYLNKNYIYRFVLFYLRIVELAILCAFEEKSFIRMWQAIGIIINGQI